MTIYNLLSEENKTVSNDYLAEQLRESYRRYKKYVAKNTPLWQQEGAKMRAIREDKRRTRNIAKIFGGARGCEFSNHR